MRVFLASGRGVYNIVDDDPAAARDWIPAFRRDIGAPAPMHVPGWLVTLLAGCFAEATLRLGRGASNAKAKMCCSRLLTKVTLRYLGRLRHIPVGTAHKNRRVNLLVAGPDVRIITNDGELIRALTLDPNRNYQPLGGRWPVHNVLQQVSTMS